MPFHALQQYGDESGAVILPKSDLRALGLVRDDGSIKNQQLNVTQVAPGEWNVKVPDPSNYPNAGSSESLAAD